MHVPDGFLTTGTVVTAGAVSAVTVGFALRQARERLSEKQVPLAGLAAAFLFAAQMINFPVATGTTGHLVGAALAAVLLGPSTGALVATVVVAIQSLAFADGGLTALGINVLNLAIIPAFAGYALFLLFRRVFSNSRSGVAAATAIAALASVVLAAMAFSIEWLFGATAPIPFDQMFGGVTSIYIAIGVGEAVISGFVVSAVLSSRPDLVYGARDLPPDAGRKAPVRLRAFILGGIVVSLFIAAALSQLASSAPDGLQKVAADTGLESNEVDHWLSDSPFASYATRGIKNEGLSLAVAGGAGTLIVLTVAYGMVAGLRASRRESGVM